MRNHDTGEFELVVGNRQLLSGFFIVVLLFAVAFAMGYVVGQNSPRSSRIGETAAASPPPVSDQSRPAASAPAPVPANPTGATGAAAESSASEAPPTEAPPQPVTQAPRVPEAAPPVPTAPPAAPQGPPGSYWQVMAVPQADAEVMVKTLKDKGFPASLTQGPNNLMRVLVGPYNDTQSMGRAKTDLENAGFHPIRK
jgi:cell division septation protein DedD